MSLPRCLAAPAVLGLLATATLHAEPNALFGTESKQGGLIGIFYDPKQTQDQKPTGVHADTYADLVDEFVRDGWNEAVLDKYFRAVKALYTTQIYIPRQKADIAPEGYGVEKFVRPGCWFVHYKGQISPPEDGVYRFVGDSDDILAVAINGKTVLYAPLWKPKQPVWTPPDPEFKSRGGGWPFVAGEWMTLKKDEPVDIDILVGERPGGEFEAFLMYQKQGVTYEWQGDRIVLPIVQLAPFDTPPAPRGQQAPPFLKNNEVWKSYQ